MIGLDTNLLVGCIVQDDPGQVDAAARLIKGRCTARSPGYVSVPALVELVWVLAGACRQESGVVAAVIRQLLRTIELLVEDRDAAWSALKGIRGGPRRLRGLPDRPLKPRPGVYADVQVRSRCRPGPPLCVGALTGNPRYREGAAPFGPTGVCPRPYEGQRTHRLLKRSKSYWPSSRFCHGSSNRISKLRKSFTLRVTRVKSC